MRRPHRHNPRTLRCARRMRQCVQDVYPAHAIAATGTTCSKRSSDDIKECIVTLSDTRQVVCVVYSGYQRGGLSCDWSHVSGADKEPAR